MATVGPTWVLAFQAQSERISIALNGPDVYVGGDFRNAGSSIVNNIAMWNGASWNGLQGGVGGTNRLVTSVVVAGGNIYAGGHFSTAGGILVNGIAGWNGANWFSLANGLSSGFINALAVDNFGKIYVTGDFTLSSSSVVLNDYAIWDGTNWSSQGAIPLSEILSITFLYEGVIIGSNSAAAGLYLWSGAKWLLADNLLDNPVLDIEIWNSKVFVGGEFDKAAFFPVGKVAYWDGDWHSMQGGVSSSNPLANVVVQAIKASADAVYGGYFDFAGAVPANHIAR
jgi:hypothetical protein